MGAEGQKNIALLIFALSPEAERLQKSLAGEKGLYPLLNQHTLQLAKTLKIPYFHFTEKEQVGESFGERYTAAIKKIFSLGYEGIITIGNDTPALTCAHLRGAYEKLQSGNAVLGPSLDGGFYLLAIPRSSFSEKAFLSIPWKSSRVFRQMQGYLKESNGSLCVLNPLADLDGHSDIALILDQYGNIPLGIKKALIKVRLNSGKAEGIFLYYYPILTNTRILNRGSPVLAA